MILSMHGLSYYEVLSLLAALGFSAGFFIVPINALHSASPR